MGLAQLHHGEDLYPHTKDLHDCDPVTILHSYTPAVEDWTRARLESATRP